MSSLRTVQSSKTSPAVKPHSPENAIIHGLCADCIVLEDEERQNFLNLLQQYLNHFRPVDEIEFGLVEEMCAARWRQRRAWSIETRMFENQIARPPDGDGLDRMVTAFDSLAAAPSLSLLHRYETRLNLTYQRTLRTLIMLRTVKARNDPSPISEHPKYHRIRPRMQPHRPSKPVSPNHLVSRPPALTVPRPPPTPPDLRRLPLTLKTALLAPLPPQNRRRPSGRAAIHKPIPRRRLSSHPSGRATSHVARVPNRCARIPALPTHRPARAACTSSGSRTERRNQMQTGLVHAIVITYTGCALRLSLREVI
jgi:hypothetical protein